MDDKEQDVRRETFGSRGAKLYIRRDVLGSNWRLVGAKNTVLCRTQNVFGAPGTDLWEDEGGCPATRDWYKDKKGVLQPTLVEIQVERFDWKSRNKMRVRGPRKQRAAKAAMKKETVTIVPVKKAAAPAYTEFLYENMDENGNIVMFDEKNKPRSKKEVEKRVLLAEAKANLRQLVDAMEAKARKEKEEEEERKRKAAEKNEVIVKFQALFNDRRNK